MNNKKSNEFLMLTSCVGFIVFKEAHFVYLNAFNIYLLH